MACALRADGPSVDPSARAPSSVALPCPTTLMDQAARADRDQKAWLSSWFSRPVDAICANQFLGDALPAADLEHLLASSPSLGLDLPPQRLQACLGAWEKTPDGQRALRRQPGVANVVVADYYLSMNRLRQEGTATHRALAAIEHTLGTRTPLEGVTCDPYLPGTCDGLTTLKACPARAGRVEEISDRIFAQLERVAYFDQQIRALRARDARCTGLCREVTQVRDLLLSIVPWGQSNEMRVLVEAYRTERAFRPNARPAIAPKDYRKLIGAALRQQLQRNRDSLRRHLIELNWASRCIHGKGEVGCYSRDYLSRLVADFRGIAADFLSGGKADELAVARKSALDILTRTTPFEFRTLFAEGREKPTAERRAWMKALYQVNEAQCRVDQRTGLEDIVRQEQGFFTSLILTGIGTSAKIAMEGLIATSQIEGVAAKTLIEAVPKATGAWYAADITGSALAALRNSMRMTDWYMGCRDFIKTSGRAAPAPRTGDLRCHEDPADDLMVSTGFGDCVSMVAKSIIKQKLIQKASGAFTSALEGDQHVPDDAGH